MSSLFVHGYALLIGVGETANPKWSLPVTVRDIQALYSVLTDPDFCAYPCNSDHVCLLHDKSATRNAILEGLNWLKQQASKDREATAFIYYSGHGAFNPLLDRYYLLQHDFDDNDVANSALSEQVFTEALHQIPAKRLLVFVDSCHAEGMATAKADETGFLPNLLPIAPSKSFVDALKQGEGRAVFTSSRGKQSSWIRPDNTMSIYTYHLVEALRGAANKPGDTVISISNLMNYLATTVQKSVSEFYQEDQTPFFDFSTEDFPVALLKGGKGVSVSNVTETSLKTASSRGILQPALEMAHRSLAILERKVSGYGSLEVPTSLLIELEDKHLEVDSLEARIKATEM